MERGGNGSLIDTRVGVAVIGVVVALLLFSISRSGSTAVLARVVSTVLFGGLSVLILWRLYRRNVAGSDGGSEPTAGDGDRGTEPAGSDGVAASGNGSEGTASVSPVLQLSVGEYRMLFACLGIATFPLVVPYDGSLTVPGVGSVVLPWYVISVAGVVGFYISYRLVG